MRDAVIKIQVSPTAYTALKTLGQTVILNMTGNLNFPSPTSPTLPALQSAVDALTDAITAWGEPGHRGSHQDLVNLRVAAANLRNLLLLEAAYVMNLVDKNLSPIEQQAFILSSGFEVKQNPAPQGVLEAPQNVRQLIQPKYSPYTPKVKWAKPLGLRSRHNAPLYSVYRSATNSFATAVCIGTTTKTVFVDMNAPRGTTQYYFVAGINAAGLGVPSAGITVLIPN